MYATQQQVEDYLQRSLTDSEAEFFEVLEAGVEDYIDNYTARTFSKDRVKNVNIDTSTGDGSSDPFQRYNGGIYEIFFDTALQTDTTKDGVIAPRLGAYNLDTFTWYPLDSKDYVFYPINGSVKTSVVPRVGVFPYGIDNVFVYGTFADCLTPPNAISVAAAALVGNIYNTTGDLKSEQIEGYQRVFDKTPPPLIQNILNSFKRVLV